MADYLLDSDVVIWHLRGHSVVSPQVISLSQKNRIGLSVITRAEIIQGMRDTEKEGTLAFLDACEALPIGPAVADRGGEIVRSFRSRGVTLSHPDALIAATALEAEIPLYTCNPRHFPREGPLSELDLCPLSLKTRR